MSNDACAPDFVCVHNVCVPGGAVSSPETISLEFAPPTGSAHVRRQYVGRPVAELLVEGFSPVLPAPTLYETSVLDAADNPIAARVSIFGDVRIPGREVDISTLVAAGATSTARFALNPGEYSVHVHPLVLPLPPIEVQGFTVREQFTVATKEFQLPPAYRTLRGEVTSSVQAGTKLAGFSVRAQGAITGLVSTSAVSDAEGAYEILLPDTQDTQFWVEARPPVAMQPAFGYRQLINVPPNTGRELMIAVEPVDPDRRAFVRLTVLGRSRAGAPIPIPNALVTVTATISRIRETPVHELSGSTGGDGIVRSEIDSSSPDVLPLLPEEYLIQVQPEEESDFAPLAEVFDFTRAGRSFVLDEQVVLQPRTVVTGRLLLASGEPAANARLDLIPVVERARPTSHLADAAGLFRLALDQGKYLLVATPVESTQEPRPVAVQRVKIQPGPESQLGNIELPMGVWVGGVVRGSPDGFPIPNVDVQAFRQIDGQTVRIALTQTDAEGAYRLALPLPSEP